MEEKFKRNNSLELDLQKRSLKIHKLYSDGTQYAENAFIHEAKETEISFEKFRELQEIENRAKKAEKEFDEIIAETMEQNRLPQYLYNLLQEQKDKAQAILQEYDDVISELTQNLDRQDKDHRQKIEKQAQQHDLIRTRVEDLVTNLNRLGKEESSSLRDNIVSHSKNISDEYRMKNDLFLEETSADKPFDSYLWKTPSEMISLEELKDAFHVDYGDNILLRQKLFAEICKLRNNLEKEKLKYILEKQSIEQDVFYFKESYNKNLQALTNLKRKQIFKLDQKTQILNELNDLKKQIEKESSSHKKSKSSSKNKSILNKTVISMATFDDVFHEKKLDAYQILSEILDTNRYIYEDILQIPWSLQQSDETEIDFKITKFDENYWSGFLDLTPDSLLLDEIIKLLEKYRHCLTVQDELRGLKESLQHDSKQLRSFLYNYRKFKDL